MRLARALARSTPGRAAIGLLLVVGVWNVWLTAQTPGKIDPAVTSAGTSDVDVLVTLNFPPERFHVLLLQKFGRVAQTVDDSVEMRGVKTDRVPEIARYYWVRRVSRLEG